MLLESLRDEYSGALEGDELMRMLNEIAEKSTINEQSVELKSSIGKTEKDKLNTKEQRSMREALQCRANSLKRAMHNVMEHSKLIDTQQKRYSVQVDNLCVFTSSSSEVSPWSSPVPPINILSPSVSTTHLTCISPLPDLRRDSMDDYFFNSLNIPVPKQFADGGSRRSSGVPQSIKEKEETIEEMFPLCKDNNKKSDTKATNNINVDYDSKNNMCRLDYLPYTENEQREDKFGLMPAEVYERNLLRNQQNNLNSFASKKQESNNTLQVPFVVIPVLEIERPPSTENVYVSDTITLIDTDPPVSTYISVYNFSEIFVLLHI